MEWLKLMRSEWQSAQRTGISVGDLKGGGVAMNWNTPCDTAGRPIQQPL